jgi:hypothetical protein
MKLLGSHNFQDTTNCYHIPSNSVLATDIPSIVIATYSVITCKRSKVFTAVTKKMIIKWM